MLAEVPVERDSLVSLRPYMGRNATTANVVRRPQEWPRGNPGARRGGEERLRGVLSEGPSDRPSDPTKAVDQPMTE